MPNEKVYLHELIDIIGQQRARYMHHMTAHWCPRSREERGQLCYGVWATFGSTGQWPQTVNVWEYDSWEAIAKAFELEVDAPTLQDPILQQWWSVASKLRSGGFDRLLVPAPWTRSIEQLVADGVKGTVYAHELVRLPPGGAVAFMDRVAEVGKPSAEIIGLVLAGAFTVAMRNDTEAILLWAIPDMPTWAAFERAWSANGPLTPWRKVLLDAGADLQRTLLVDSPLNPMKIGRQPSVTDQRPLEDFFPPLT